MKLRRVLGWLAERQMLSGREIVRMVFDGVTGGIGASVGLIAMAMLNAGSTWLAALSFAGMMSNPARWLCLLSGKRLNVELQLNYGVLAGLALGGVIWLTGGFAPVPHA